MDEVLKDGRYGPRSQEYGQYQEPPAHRTDVCEGRRALPEFYQEIIEDELNVKAGGIYRRRAGIYLLYLQAPAKDRWTQSTESSWEISERP